MKVLDLFSGIGGFSLGLERSGMETVAFCEIDEYCRKILSKHWPDVPIYDDVRTLNYEGTVDIICGGFPCQDLSVSGTQSGIEDGVRSSLWNEMLKHISNYKPKYAIIENVTNLITGGKGQWFGKFLNDLAKIGYNAEWHCIPATYFGSLHHRDRVWIIAYPNGVGWVGMAKGIKGKLPTINSKTICKGWADKNNVFFPVGKPFVNPRSGVCRVDDGIPAGLDRLKGLGNAVVPQIPELIGRAIMQFENKF